MSEMYLTAENPRQRCLWRTSPETLERPPHQSGHVINRSNIHCPRECAVSKTLYLPYAPNVWPQAHADHILKDGHPVGISSGTIYSYYFREVLSMGCVDPHASKIGTEVIVQWGYHGGRIKDVRHNGRAFPLPDRGTEQRPRRLHDQVSAPCAVIVPRVPRLHVSSSVTLAKSGM